MAPSELGFRLKCAREKAGLSQKDAARISGVGEKTISSFESGSRAQSMKVSQLEALLDAYGLTVQQFFDPAFDEAVTEPAPAPVRTEKPEPMRRAAHPADPLAGTRRDSDHSPMRSSLGVTHADHSRR